MIFSVACLATAFLLGAGAVDGVHAAYEDGITIFPRHIQNGTTDTFVIGGLPKGAHMDIYISSENYTLAAEHWTNSDLSVSTLPSNEGGLAYLTITAPGVPDGKHLQISFYDDGYIGSVKVYETNQEVTYTRSPDHSPRTAFTGRTFHVDEHWPLIPDGLGVGDKFYLMFSTKDANGGGRSGYNPAAEVAASQHPALELYAKWMIPFVNTDERFSLREQVYTQNAWFGNEHDQPIYWLGGDKIANSFNDLHDGTWESTGRDDIRTQFGTIQQDSKGNSSSSTISYKEHWTGSPEWPLGGTRVSAPVTTVVSTFSEFSDVDAESGIAGLEKIINQNPDLFVRNQGVAIWCDGHGRDAGLSIDRPRGSGQNINYDENIKQLWTRYGSTCTASIGEWEDVETTNDVEYGPRLATYNDITTTGRGTGGDSQGSVNVLRPILVITPMFEIQEYTGVEPPPMFEIQEYTGVEPPPMFEIQEYTGVEPLPAGMPSLNADVRPANTAPTMIISVSGTPAVGHTLVFFISAYDADGDALTYSVDADFGTLDGDAGTFTWTPGQSDVGDHAITFAVSDGTDTAYATTYITVTDAQEQAGTEEQQERESRQEQEQPAQRQQQQEEQQEPPAEQPQPANVIGISSSATSIPGDGGTATITVSLDAPLEQGQKTKVKIKVQGCGKAMKHCSLTFDGQNSDADTKKNGDGKKSTLIFREGAQTISMTLHAAPDAGDKDRNVKITLDRVVNSGGAAVVLEDDNAVSISMDGRTGAKN